MKAIETIYNGYKFRSRLEARWAVFFDQLHIEYQYESEGYVLENGLCYLPDFYLPSLGVYVEIKPAFNILSREDILKIDAFRLGENNNLLLIIGSPTNQAMYLINRCNMLPYYDVEESYKEYTDNIGEAYQFALQDCCAEVDFATDVFDNKWAICFKNLRTDYYDCSYKDALLQAKQSRFEFKDKQH